MSGFVVDVNTRKLVQALILGGERLVGDADLAVQRTAIEIGRKLKKSAPKAFSTLTNSITSSRRSLMHWRVGPHVAYSEYVEKGSRSGGFPPLKAILSWIRVKGISPRNPSFSTRDLAWAIRRKIGSQGIKAQPFVEPLIASGFPQRRLQQLVDKAAQRAFKKAGL